MTRCRLDDSAQYHRTPFESQEDWISRITSYRPKHIQRETTRTLSSIGTKSVVDDIQKIFTAVGNQIRDEDLDKFDAETDDFQLQSRRTEELKRILPSLAYLWCTNSDQFEVATEKIADGSRNFDWRMPIGESGIFTFFLKIFSGHELSTSLKIQIFRLIGNSCAETDDNRARIGASSDYVLPIIGELKNTSILPFAIPVLYNICEDYTPNQILISEAYVTKELIGLLAYLANIKAEKLIEHVCHILTLLVSQPSEFEFAPEDTVAVLFKCAAYKESPVSLENFIYLINIGSCYLHHEKFQRALVCADGSLKDTITILEDSYMRYDSQPTLIENDDLKNLTTMRTCLIQALSDVSALPEFIESCPMSSHFSSTLQQWLVASDPKIQLQVCACIMLGNIARSDVTCIEFVQTLQLHKPLITIASRETLSQLLHATLGLLRNLSIPLTNKGFIGEAGIFPVLSRVWALDVIPQVQLSAVSLGRLLTIGTFENVDRLIHQSSFNMTETIFLSLCALFNRSDEESIKIEIARLTSSVYRVLFSQTGPSWDMTQSTRIQFSKIHSETGKHLKFLVSQTKWPAVRGEGLFVLALTSRIPEGAAFVTQLLQDQKFFELITELILEGIVVDSPLSSSASTSNESVPLSLSCLNPEPIKPHTQADEMVRLNRENALILVSEILKNCSSEMTALQKTKLSNLLKRGAMILMNYMEKKTDSPGTKT